MAQTERRGARPGVRLTVGKVAAAAGTTPRTVRYYANMGLLANEGRTEGQRRRFSERDVYILRFIQRLKVLGLSLEQIRDLNVAGADDAEISNVVGLLDRHLEAIEGRIRELRILRKDIQAYKDFIETHR
ncbi:MAG TPA: MerR family transcriptional regulator [Geobacteraceae bacterium]